MLQLRPKSLCVLGCIFCTAGFFRSAKAIDDDPPQVEQIQLTSAEGDQPERDRAEEELLIPTSLQTQGEKEIILEGPTVLESDIVTGEYIIDSSEIDEEQSSASPEDEQILFGDWVGYNATRDATTWLPGSGDDFGMVSLESFPTLSLSNEAELVSGMGFHFLNGPIKTDMPPRLFDFQLAFQSRATRSQDFVLDYKIGVGVFSDFEGSARKGVRFPGHVVGYYQWQPWFLSVLGVEFLDRDDVSVLPVAGFIWRPRNNVVVQCVFPKPQLQVKVRDDAFIFLSGELGGGTWAIERANDTNDVVTYRDLRLLYGIARLDEDSASSIEVGWAFSRSLEYRSGLGNHTPDDAFLLRFRSLY